jgi:hypothetical protein
MKKVLNMLSFVFIFFKKLEENNKINEILKAPARERFKNYKK